MSSSWDRVADLLRDLTQRGEAEEWRVVKASPLRLEQFGGEGVLEEGDEDFEVAGTLKEYRAKHGLAVGDTVTVLRRRDGDDHDYMAIAAHDGKADDELGGGGAVPDASAAEKGLIQLAGDLGGTAAVPRVVTLNGRAVAALVFDDDPALTDARAPTGPAGGVLSGAYPNPGFAVDMATQAELDAEAAARAAALAAHVAAADPHPVYATDAQLSTHAALSGKGGHVPVGGLPATDLSFDVATQAELDAAIIAAKARANHTGTQLAATISDFVTTVRAQRLDQMAAPTAAVPMNGQKLTGLAAASANGDAVRWEQIQGLATDAELAAYLPLVGGSLTGMLRANGGQTPLFFGGDIDTAKWLVALGGFKWRLLNDNTNVASTGSGDKVVDARTYRPKLDVGPDGALDAAGPVSSAGVVLVKTNDARLSDQRTPSDASVSWAKTGVGAAGLAQYAFSARRPSTSVTLTGAVSNALGCSTEEHDIGGAYDAPNGEYVVPVAGVYFFEVHCVWTNAPANTRYRLILFDDAAGGLGSIRELTLIRNWSAGTEDIRLIGATTISLPAGARIEPRVVGIDATSSGQIYGSSTYDATRWSGHLVGKT